MSGSAIAPRSFSIGEIEGLIARLAQSKSQQPPTSNLTPNSELMVKSVILRQKSPQSVARRQELDIDVRLALAIAVGISLLFFLILALLGETAIAELFLERGFTQYLVVFLAATVGAIAVLKYRRIDAEERALRRFDLPETVALSGAPTPELTILRQELSRSSSAIARRCYRILTAYWEAGNRAAAIAIAADDAAFYESASSNSYILPRILIWAIPLLGFIGTVIGISSAVGGFSGFLAEAADIEQLRTGIGSVTSGLAVAFDTTFVALLLAVLTTIPLALVERQEARLLLGMDVYINDELLPRLSTPSQQKSPILASETAMVGLRDMMPLLETQRQELREIWNEQREQQQATLEAIVNGIREATTARDSSPPESGDRLKKFEALIRTFEQQQEAALLILERQQQQQQNAIATILNGVSEAEVASVPTTAAIERSPLADTTELTASMTRLEEQLEKQQAAIVSLIEAATEAASRRVMPEFESLVQSLEQQQRASLAAIDRQQQEQASVLEQMVATLENSVKTMVEQTKEGRSPIPFQQMVELRELLEVAKDQRREFVELWERQRQQQQASFAELAKEIRNSISSSAGSSTEEDLAIAARGQARQERTNQLLEAIFVALQEVETSQQQQQVSTSPLPVQEQASLAELAKEIRQLVSRSQPGQPGLAEAIAALQEERIQLQTVVERGLASIAETGTTGGFESFLSAWEERSQQQQAGFIEVIESIRQMSARLAETIPPSSEAAEQQITQLRALIRSSSQQLREAFTTLTAQQERQYEALVRLVDTLGEWNNGSSAAAIKQSEQRDLTIVETVDRLEKNLSQEFARQGERVGDFLTRIEQQRQELIAASSQEQQQQQAIFESLTQLVEAVSGDRKAKDIPALLQQQQLALSDCQNYLSQLANRESFPTETLFELCQQLRSETVGEISALKQLESERGTQLEALIGESSTFVAAQSQTNEQLEAIAAGVSQVAETVNQIVAADRQASTALQPILTQLQGAIAELSPLIKQLKQPRRIVLVEQETEEES